MNLRKIIRTLPGFDPYKDAAGYRFDAKKAAKVIRFFETCLRHSEGPMMGQLIKLERWQKAILANAFGWVDKVTGLRRFREVFVYVPRKNGKTTLGGGIALWHLCCDAEPAPRVYSGASDQDTAAQVWDAAIGMVLQEPALANRVQTYKTGRTMQYPAKNGTWKVLAAEAKTKHGRNASAVLIDELHVTPADLVDVLETSQGARAQPITWYFTTADYYRPSICNEKYEHAVKVRDGALSDPQFLPAVYEAPQDADIADPAVQALANPNLGVSIFEAYIKREVLKGLRNPRYRNTVKRLHFNIRTQAAVSAIEFTKWQACGGAAIDVEELLGEPCFLGIDLSTSRDLCAVVAYFPRTHQVLPWFWAPRACAEERALQEFDQYLAWADEGHMTLVDGPVMDYGLVKQQVIWCAEHFEVVDAAYDPYNATPMVNELDAEEGMELTSYTQSFKAMNPAVREVERLYLSGLLKHGNQPVLNWNAATVMAEEDRDQNVRYSKRKSSDRIDGMVALAMAVGLAVSTELDEESVYETQGIDSV